MLVQNGFNNNKKVKMALSYVFYKNYHDKGKELFQYLALVISERLSQKKIAK